MNLYNQQRRGIALWQVSLFFATIVLLAAIIGPIFISFDTGRSSPERSQICAGNLRKIMLGAAQYTQDYDGFYPLLADNAPQHGWVVAMKPYVPNEALFQCPTENYDPAADKLDPAEKQFTDYWFNGRLAGLSEKKLSHPESTLIMGDGNNGDDETNANYNITKIPESWRTKTAPLVRHDEGANFAFADGHVAWYDAKKWKDETTLGGNSFLPRVGK